MANDNFKTLGAGWKRTSKSGNTYLALSFDAQALQGLDLSQMNVMVFPNKSKQNPKSPDYTISATEKTNQRSAPSVPSRPQAVSRPQVKNYAPAQAVKVDEDDF